MLSHSLEKKQDWKRYSELVFLLFFIIIIALFLSSCNGINSGSNGATANYHLGMTGFEIKFLDQQPPNDVYENSNFVAGFTVENSGATNVNGNNYGILSLSFDPFYIDTSGMTGTGNVQVAQNSVTLGNIQLVGKSQLNPSGASTVVSFPGFKAKTILGQMGEPTTDLLVSMCYPYNTVYSGVVCVDYSLAGQDLRKQVCYQKSLDLSSGQGAPIAITKIEVENQPVTSGGTSVAVRPVFTVHVQNKGQGNVLSPVSGAGLDRVCSLQDITKQDFNTINIQAALSASTILTCTPNPIKIVNDEGISRCEVSDTDLVVGTHNYETTLNINLSYVYLSSASKKIMIKRLNPYGGITDINGQILYQKKKDISNIERINISALSKGIYLLKVLSQKYIKIEKIVKL